MPDQSTSDQSGRTLIRLRVKNPTTDTETGKVSYKTGDWHFQEDPGNGNKYAARKFGCRKVRDARQKTLSYLPDEVGTHATDGRTPFGQSGTLSIGYRSAIFEPIPSDPAGGTSGGHGSGAEWQFVSGWVTPMKPQAPGHKPSSPGSAQPSLSAGHSDESESEDGGVSLDVDGRLIS